MSNDISQTLSRILAGRNHFETLGVMNIDACTADEVKKTYRRLAAFVHPDKCTDSRAHEAFSKIEKAAKILMDEGTLSRIRDQIRRKRLREEELGDFDPSMRNKSSGTRSASVSDALEQAKQRQETETYKRMLREQRERAEHKRNLSQRKQEDKVLNEQLGKNLRNWKSHQHKHSIHRSGFL